MSAVALPGDDRGWLTARPFAHRGLHDLALNRPENTLAAVQAAIDGGYGIEIDVQPAQDATPMMVHDSVLTRLAGRPDRVDALSPGELRRITVLGSDEIIPTLAETLDLIAGRAPLLVEIKSLFDGAVAVAEKTADLLSTYDGPAAAMSFDADMLHAIRASHPDVVVGMVSCRFERDEDWAWLSDAKRAHLGTMPGFDAIRPDFVGFDCRDLPDSRLSALRDRHALPILSWTVRDQDMADRLDGHVDQIIFEGFRPTTR